MSPQLLPLAKPDDFLRHEPFELLPEEALRQLTIREPRVPEH